MTASDSLLEEVSSRLIQDADGTGRYLIRRLLGEGTSGRVYHVADTLQRRQVALKTLKALQPDEVYRLKREFRALLDVTHPNLVHLHELVVRSEVAYFTMELVEGSHLLDWIWEDNSPANGVGLDSEQLGRLRGGFSQLVSAVHTLHSLSRIHRDIKPSNVVVARDGRVVLVDLGLCVDLRSTQCEQSMEGQLAGTLQYMSPEQARGRLLTPASDWFSVGVLLFEALTGELPFDGLLSGMLLDEASAAAELRVRLSAAPRELVDLTCSLLQFEPSARLGAPAILRALPASRVVPIDVPVQLRAGALLGREAEIKRLRQGLLGLSPPGVRLVTVRGKAGVGKTALGERVLSRFEEDGALVLRARCHYREKVPYKGVDGLVDNLSRFLTACDAAKVARWLPRRLQELLETFPTLRRVPGLSELESLSPVGLTADEAPQPNAVTRHRAFVALRELIQAIAEEQQVILWVDDLQWVDRDSLIVLQTLVASRRARNVALVLSYRPGVAAGEDVALRLIHDVPAARVTRLELLPLAVEAMRMLVKRWVPSMTEEQVAEVIQAAAGSPFVAREVCRDVLSESSRSRLRETNEQALMEQLLVGKLDTVPEHARTLFGVVCVAGFPMDERLLARLEVGLDVRSTVGVLVNRGLLKYVVERGQAVLDVGHDALRDVFLRHAGQGRVEEAYQKLSTLITESELVDPFQRVEFVAKTGDRDAAARLAREAAERAEARAAFHLAAALFQRYLKLSDAPDWNARARLGHALCEAGRVSEGVEELIRAADGLEGDEQRRAQATRLRAIAAERLMAKSYQIERGLRVMNRALAAFNIRYASSVGKALWWLLFNLPRVLLAKLAWRVRGWLGYQSRRPPGDELELQVLWSAGSAVAQLEPIRAAQFHARHALRAYRADNEDHIALSLCVDAVISAMLGGARRCRRSLELRVRAQRLAARSRSQYVLGFIETQTAAQYYFMGRWRDAAKLADRAELTCRRERLGMASQITLARFLGQTARAYQGKALEVRSRTPDLLVELDAIHDWRSTACLRLGWLNMATWLCWGEAAEAEHHLQKTRELLDPDTFNSVSYLHLIASVNLALYQGDAHAAWQQVKQQWANVKQSHQLRLTIPHYELVEARGRAAVALAGQCAGAKQRRSLLREAERCVAQLKAMPLPFALASSLALAAALSRLNGQERRLLEQLHCASLEYSSCGMDMHAAACAWLLRQQRHGVPCLDAAEQWFNEQEITAPERVVATLIPIPVAA